MAKFSEVFGYLNRRKKLLKKLRKVQDERDQLEQSLAENDSPFFNGEIDLKQYRRFFEEFDIASTGGVYSVTDIHISHDCDGKQFWEASYIFTELNERGFATADHDGKLSLRKLLHILDHPMFELKKK